MAPRMLSRRGSQRMLCRHRSGSIVRARPCPLGIGPHALSLTAGPAITSNEALGGSVRMSNRTRGAGCAQGELPSPTSAPVRMLPRLPTTQRPSSAPARPRFHADPPPVTPILVVKSASRERAGRAVGEGGASGYSLHGSG